MAVWRSRGTGNPPGDFFADEYRLNAMIDGWPKPYVALIDGIVMGGGVGISGHGSHRVFTENATLAMPEVGIGFFPDVGASHLLPHLGGWFGMYLALTGNRIRCGDALWSGLATHTMKAEYSDGLIERLAETGDPDLALREVFAPARRETDDATLHKISKHFAGPSLKDIVESLELAALDDDFARQALETVKKRSPTSLNVAFREVTAGLTLSMAECMRMEFRILNRMLEGHDFYEGIRAAIVDKGDAPRWRPATLAEVDPADIDRYFAPLGEHELVL
jgi:enoyl-CoA hydratase